MTFKKYIRMSKDSCNRKIVHDDVIETDKLGIKFTSVYKALYKSDKKTTLLMSPFIYVLYRRIQNHKRLNAEDFI